MKYSKTVVLKDGRQCLLRNGVEQDAQQMIFLFDKTHEETDFLLSCPEESSHTCVQEAEFLKDRLNSDRAVELVAIVDGKLVGSASVEPVGPKFKVCHRSEFGISVLKEFWGLGIGNALIEASIENALKAGYSQLELDAVSGNERAINLYRKYGFEQFGLNPKGFNSKTSGYQELVLMRLDLERRYGKSNQSN